MDETWLSPEAEESDLHEFLGPSQVFSIPRALALSVHAHHVEGSWNVMPNRIFPKTYLN